MASSTCLRKYCFCIFLFSVLFSTTESNLPEQGVFELQFNKQHEYQHFRRTMYGGTDIELHINCTDGLEKGNIQLGWLVRGTGCFEEYNKVDEKYVPVIYASPRAQLSKELTYNQSTQLVCTDLHDYDCMTHTLTDCDELFNDYDIDLLVPATKSAGASKAKPTVKSATTAAKKTTAKSVKPVTMAAPTAASTKLPAPTTKPAKRKRAVPPITASVVTVPSTPTTTMSSKSDSAAFVRPLGYDDGGVYLFIVKVRSHAKSNATVTVKINHKFYGYISPIDYPLLVVYGILCTVYIIYAIAWLILLALNWKDILRLQYWIAGVIVLGLLEKAVLVSEYDSVFRTGVSVRGAAIFGAIVSCVKRTLARMLIIIASVGFGIVKPRLGPMLNKVLGVGALYMILACIAAWYNTTLDRIDTSKSSLALEVVLVVLDAAICWWIFSNLITTLRTLRLRRNIVKHSVYRHFTHTLIVAVLVSVGFIIWSLLVHKQRTCITDYSTYWLDEAFWPILFTAILLVIIFLWRPTTNNQRYAFSPLLDNGEDDDDDDEDEIMMSDAYEGMKQRGTREKTPRKDLQTKAEEDLKWVEDNIPASIADKTLGLDSDEEIKQTRFEMGKME